MCLSVCPGTRYAPLHRGSSCHFLVYAGGLLGFEGQGPGVAPPATAKVGMPAHPDWARLPATHEERVLAAYGRIRANLCHQEASSMADAPEGFASGSSDLVSVAGGDEQPTTPPWTPRAKPDGEREKCPSCDAAMCQVLVGNCAFCGASASASARLQPNAGRGTELCVFHCATCEFLVCVGCLNGFALEEPALQSEAAGSSASTPAIGCVQGSSSQSVTVSAAGDSDVHPVTVSGPQAALPPPSPGLQALRHDLAERVAAAETALHDGGDATSEAAGVHAAVQEAVAVVEDVLEAERAGAPSRQHRQWQISCESCNTLRFGRQATRHDARGTCCSCAARVVYRKWIYACRSCSTLLCSKCAHAEHAAAKLPRNAPAVNEISNGIGESQSASSALGDASHASDELLRLLRLLPAAFPRSPLLWIPRRTKQQIGSILRQLLAAATRTANAASGDHSAESAHLLCRAATQILLRAPVQAEEQAGDWHAEKEGTAGAKSAALVRDSVRLALEGKWVTLVEQCLSDIAAERNRVRDNPDVPAVHGNRDAEGKLTPAAAQSATLRARTCSTRAASSVLIGGPPVPPGPAADAGVQALFRTEALNDTERAKLEQALNAAAAIPHRRRLRVTPRLVGRQAATLKPAAGPGGSGWRNSHIHFFFAERDGPLTLAAWCNVWSQGAVSPWIADLWTGALARPFWKDELQESMRPVLCSEALLKFAMGTCVRGANCQIVSAAVSRQYAAGRSSGAALEVAEVRAAASLFPQDALMGLDIKNAFGEVAWSDALLAAVDKAPRLAVPMAAMWRNFSMTVYLKDADSHDWHAFKIYGSLIEGNLESQPAFCLVIAVVLHIVIMDPRLSHWSPRIRHWLFVDDWIMQVPLEAALTLLDAVREATASRQLPLQVKKCTFHVPALEGVRREDCPEQARLLAQHISYSADGLVLLGTEACGDQAIPLYQARQPDCIPKHTLQRKQKAIKLAEATLEMIALAPPAGAEQAGFTLARNIVARALDYDAGVLPCSILLPHAGDIDAAVMRIAAATVDLLPEQLTSAQLLQLRLPVRYAGMQLDLPSHSLPLARAARLAETGPALWAAVASWAAPGAPLDARLYDGVDHACADGLLQ
jgi:hypothetical protein